MTKQSKIRLLGLDICCILMGLNLVLQITSFPSVTGANTYLWEVCRLIPINLACLWGFDLYIDRPPWSYRQLLKSLIAAELVFIVGIALLSFLKPIFMELPWGILAGGVIAQCLAVILERTIYWLVMRLVHGKKKMLVVSSNPSQSLMLVARIREHTGGWYTVCNILLPEEISLTSVLTEVDALFLADNLTVPEKRQTLQLALARGKEVIFGPDFTDLFIRGASLGQIDDLPLLAAALPGLSPEQKFVKRIMDIMLSAVGLILVAPVMLFLYLIIPLNSPGNAIFKQERIGLYGRPFMLYKFRSMVLNAEANTGPVLATETDSRVTGLGRFIRATRLDELPQLVNVLKGDMSLVGPRPERAYFIKSFQQSYREYDYRLLVKPGVTGLAQVHGKYSTGVEDKLKYDLRYLINYSLRADLKIILQTFLVLVTREKSKGVKIGDQS